MGEVPYKSMNAKIQTPLYCAFTKTVSDLLEKIRVTIDLKLEIGEPLEDEFMAIVCRTIERFAFIIQLITEINSEVITTNDFMATAAVTMLSDFYSTLLCLTQRVSLFTISIENTFVPCIYNFLVPCNAYCENRHGWLAIH